MVKMVQNDLRCFGLDVTHHNVFGVCKLILVHLVMFHSSTPTIDISTKLHDKGQVNLQPCISVGGLEQKSSSSVKRDLSQARILNVMISRPEPDVL